MNRQFKRPHRKLHGKYKKRPIIHKGILDFFTNLIGGNPPPQPNINSKKYTYNMVNKNQYTNMVNKINSYMQEQIQNVTLKTCAELNISQNFLLQNIVVAGNVTIDLDFYQKAKILQTSELTVSVVQSMKQNIIQSLKDSVFNQFKTDNVLNTKDTLIKASSSSLVDSWLAPISNKNETPTQTFFDQNQNIQNIMETDLSTSINNSNSATSTSNVISSITTNINQVQSTQISGINVGGNFNLIGTFDQGLDFIMDVLLDTNFAQNIINSVNDSTYFSIDTSSINTNVTKQEILQDIKDNSEGIGDIFGGLLSGLLPIALVGGAVVIGALIFLPKNLEAATPLAAEIGETVAAVETGGASSMFLPGKGPCVKRKTEDEDENKVKRIQANNVEKEDWDVTNNFLLANNAFLT